MVAGQKAKSIKPQKTNIEHVTAARKQKTLFSHVIIAPYELLKISNCRGALCKQCEKNRIAFNSIFIEILNKHVLKIKRADLYGILILCGVRGTKMSSKMSIFICKKRVHVLFSIC